MAEEKPYDAMEDIEKGLWHINKAVTTGKFSKRDFEFVKKFGQHMVALSDKMLARIAKDEAAAAGGVAEPNPRAITVEGRT
jgi:hypothetical protein